VAGKLRQNGFTRIRPLLGGLDAWIDAGMPVDGVLADLGEAQAAARA
jgi:rhodanese-related sulfurtransferase